MSGTLKSIGFLVRGKGVNCICTLGPILTTYTLHDLFLDKEVLCGNGDKAASRL